MTASNPTGNNDPQRINPSMMGMNLNEEFQALPVTLGAIGSPCDGCEAADPIVNGISLAPGATGASSFEPPAQMFWAGVIEPFMGEAETTVVMQLTKVSITPISGECEITFGNLCQGADGCQFLIKYDFAVLNTGPSTLQPSKVMVGQAFTTLPGNLSTQFGSPIAGGSNPTPTLTPSATVPGAFEFSVYTEYSPFCGSGFNGPVSNTDIDLYTYVNIQGVDRSCKMVPFGLNGFNLTLNCGACPDGNGDDDDEDEGDGDDPDGGQ